MNTQIKDIGMRLSFMREEVELSVEEMAQKLGVDVDTYCAYERGEMDFSFSFRLNYWHYWNYKTLRGSKHACSKHGRR